VEARAINASLHTLGQVIAALSALSTAATAAAAARVHVPWRDSKLTRLLVGNLGGTSNTYLLATVGPAPANAGESLSTLLFASRCMRVSASPVPSQPHTQHDYAELAAALQARLDGCEAAHATELEATRARYEAALRDLSAELEGARRAAEGGTGAGAYTTLNVSLVSAGAEDGGSGGAKHPAAAGGGGGGGGHDGAVAAPPSLERLYAHLCAVFDEGAAAVWANISRHAEHGRAWARAIAAAQSEGDAEAAARGGGGGLGSSAPAAPSAAAAAALMRSPLNDTAAAELRRVGLLPPLPAKKGDSPRGGVAKAGEGGGGGGGGGAFASRPAAQAMHAVHLQHSTNNSFPADAGGEGEAPPPQSLLSPPAAPGAWPPVSPGGSVARFPHPPFSSLPSVEALLAQCARLAHAASLNAARLGLLAAAKDARFNEVKRHLAAAEAALRLRDEDVQSQRYVLRYLVDTTAKLREELRRAKGKAAAALSGDFEDFGDEGGSDGGGGGEEGGGALLGAAAAATSAMPITPMAPPAPAPAGGGSWAAAAAAAASRPPRPAAKPPSPKMAPPAAPLPTTTVSLLDPVPSPHGGGEGGGDEDVECIVEQRHAPVPGSANGALQLLYKVRWRGAGAEEDEWFPAADLLCDFPHVVAAFERSKR
jgi:hypothetical protein